MKMVLFKISLTKLQNTLFYIDICAYACYNLISALREGNFCYEIKGNPQN